MANKDGDGGLNIQGGVHTGGGDFVGRDKMIKGGANSVVIGGNASGNTIVTGNGNVVGNTSSGSLEELRALLQQMQAILPQAGLDEDTVEVIEGDFAVVEKQLAKPEPKKSIMCCPRCRVLPGHWPPLLPPGKRFRSWLPWRSRRLSG